jgi:DNA-binding LytR/AlgR family response regulator
MTVADADPAPGMDRAAGAAERLVVQTGRGSSVVRYEDIECLEAARNYVTVHAAGREYVMRETMASLARRLSDGPFARSHRSYIVNVDRIEEIRAVDSQYRIRLSGGREIPLSRTYREAFRAFLSG